MVRASHVQQLPPCVCVSSKDEDLPRHNDRPLYVCRRRETAVYEVCVYMRPGTASLQVGVDLMRQRKKPQLSLSVYSSIKCFRNRQHLICTAPVALMRGVLRIGLRMQSSRTEACIRPRTQGEISEHAGRVLWGTYMGRAKHQLNLQPAKHKRSDVFTDYPGCRTAEFSTGQSSCAPPLVQGKSRRETRKMICSRFGNRKQQAGRST